MISKARVLEALNHVDAAGYESNQPDYKGTGGFVEVNGEEMFTPTPAELAALESRGKGGSPRTLQLMKLALAELDVQGEADLPDADELAKRFPPLPMPNIAWDVYGPDEEDGHVGLLDTVFFGGTCDRQYVLDALIDHDGYHPGIEIVARR